MFTLCYLFFLRKKLNYKNIKLHLNVFFSHLLHSTVCAFLRLQFTAIIYSRIYSSILVLVICDDDTPTPTTLYTPARTSMTGAN